MAFLVDFGLAGAAVLGFEAALEPEPLRILAGVPALEPSLGGALFTAGEDIVVELWSGWMSGIAMVCSCGLNKMDCSSMR